MTCEQKSQKVPDVTSQHAARFSLFIIACFSVPGVVGTTRFCSSRDMGNQCQFIRYPDHDRVYRACIYTCRGSGCNGAESVTSRIPFTLLLPALFLTLFSILSVRL